MQRMKHHVREEDAVGDLLNLEAQNLGAFIKILIQNYVALRTSEHLVVCVMVF